LRGVGVIGRVRCFQICFQNARDRALGPSDLAAQVIRRQVRVFLFMLTFAWPRIFDKTNRLPPRIMNHDAK